MWNNITIDSKELIDSFIKNNITECDYQFTNLLIWSKGDKVEYMIKGNVLLIRGNYLDGVTYFCPISKTGNLDEVKEAIDEILETGQNIELVPEKYYDYLSKFYNLIESRDAFDYIYNSEDLAHLPGRKYSKKKNKINQFKKNYNWKYEMINDENFQRVVEFQEKWCIRKNCFENSDLSKEYLGIKLLFENYKKLNLIGGVIFVDNEIIGYTIGEEVNSDMLLVHVEKADEIYNGSYQAINQLFIEAVGLSYKEINREDDYGQEGLRQAKESYIPSRMQKKYLLTK